MPKWKIVNRRGQSLGQSLRYLLLVWLLLAMFAPAGVLAQAAEPPSPAPEQVAPPEPPEVGARAAILVDYETGRIIYSKQPHDIIALASTTKIVTALVALEHSKLDEIVTGNADDEVGESAMGLMVGEQQTMHDMLYGMLLPSGNDAATAIARHVGERLTEPKGEQDPLKRFAALMNQEAQSLGMHDSHFSNPHGLDAEDHVSSVYDLATVTWYALHNPTFAEIVRTTSYSIPGHYFLNTNELLTRYPGADGVKTGMTDNAGLCLVGSATRDGRRLISVVLNSPSWYDDSRVLLDYGFADLEAQAGKPPSGERLEIAQRAGIAWSLADAVPTEPAPPATPLGAAPPPAAPAASPTPLILSETQGAALPVVVAAQPPGSPPVPNAVLVSQPVSTNYGLWAVGVVVLGLAVVVVGKRYGLINPAIPTFNRGRKLAAYPHLTSPSRGEEIVELSPLAEMLKVEEAIEPEPTLAPVGRSQQFELSYTPEVVPPIDEPLLVVAAAPDADEWLREQAWRAIEYAYAERQGSALVEFTAVVRVMPRFEFSELPGFYEMPAVGFLALARAYVNVQHPRFAIALLRLAGQRYPGDTTIRSLRQQLEQGLLAGLKDRRIEGLIGLNHNSCRGGRLVRPFPFFKPTLTAVSGEVNAGRLR